MGSKKMLHVKRDLRRHIVCKDAGRTGIEAQPYLSSIVPSPVLLNSLAETPLMPGAPRPNHPPLGAV